MQVDRVTASKTSALDAARFLSVGVATGFIAGLLIGGVGGRLAMLVLRLTSDPALHGMLTDDEFTIGVVSGETFFLLAATALVGAIGGVLYLIARTWVPRRARGWASAVVFGSIGAAFSIRPGGIDFTLLSPIPLAAVMFVALPVAYGLVLSWAIERALERPASNRIAVFLGLLPLAPLALLGGIGAVIAFGAIVVWEMERSAPRVAAMWHSAPVVWAGRALLLIVAVRFFFEAASDTLEVL